MMNSLTRQAGKVFACMYLAIVMVGHTYAQSTDTLRLDLPTAERMFLERNLALVAAKYDISISKALEEQAGKWENPVLQTDQNIYAGNRFFAHGKDASGQIQGQYFIQIQQLIKTAGKRSKLINMAATTTRIAELQFGEMMRSLKYQLRTSFYANTLQQDLYRLQKEQMAVLQPLLKGMQAQLDGGNIAQRDYLRIQSMIVSLQQDMAATLRNVNEWQVVLKSLLQTTDDAFVQTIALKELPQPGDLQFEALLEKAKQYNTAYLIQKESVTLQQQNLLYQKALKVPDITVGTSYDHNSNYAPHYWGIGFSLPLPIFNKNQGNIKAAQFSVKQEENNMLQAGDQLNIQVQGALLKLRTAMQWQQDDQKDFYNKYGQMLQKMTQSYQTKQIGLLEFTDFFNSYRDMLEKRNEQQLNYLNSLEELRFQTGTDQ